MRRSSNHFIAHSTLILALCFGTAGCAIPIILAVGAVGVDPAWRCAVDLGPGCSAYRRADDGAIGALQARRDG